MEMQATDTPCLAAYSAAIRPAPPAPTTILFDPSDPERWTAPTTESVDDYEGWTETAFLPSVKYAVVWDEARYGWAVLTLDDGGAFS